jgi:hypothetical protein
MPFTPGWITKAGPFHVEKLVCKDSGTIELSRPPVGVGHTTECTFEQALDKFRHTDAPNFLVGRDAHGKVRILQLVALGRCACALENRGGGVETNHWVRAQIELAADSKTHPWLPDDELLGAFSALVAQLKMSAGIPLVRPFPDELDPAQKWAVTTNPRRTSGKWGDVAGWFNHLEVPENDHWDMGAFRWSEAFKRAHAFLEGKPQPEPATLPPWFSHWADWRLGRGEFSGLGKAEPAHRPAGVPSPIPEWAWKRLEHVVGSSHAPVGAHH